MDVGKKRNWKKGAVVMAETVDMVGWKTFRKRLFFNVLVKRLAVEDEGIREAIEAATTAGFIPQEITVTRDDEFENAVTNINVECRPYGPDETRGGSVLCTVHGPERGICEWYDLGE